MQKTLRAVAACLLRGRIIGSKRGKFSEKCYLCHGDLFSGTMRITIRTKLLLLAALCGTGAVRAQDLIVRRDSSRVEARVSEISPESVRYRRFSNPDGPVYVLPVAEVAYIRYANGEVERFASPEAPAVAAAAAAEEGRYVLRRYEVGEYYDRNGVRGVVVCVAEDGQHGLLMSLDEACLHWSGFRKPDLREVGADDRADGRVNMERVAAYIDRNGLAWDDFPAFKWCREQGEGWYLPAIDEMLMIGHNYNGGNRLRPSRQTRGAVNDALKGHGGDKMDRLVYYFTSTEIDEKSVYTTHMAPDPPYVVPIPKYNRFLVRAVRRF